MARLFELSSNFETIFDMFDDIQAMEFEKNSEGQAIDYEGNSINPEEYKAEMLQKWFETLETLEEEFEAKAENTAQYIKSLKVEETALKNEEEKLRKRRQQCGHKIEILTEYLKNCMLQMNLKKVETSKTRISIRNNAPSLKITDTEALVDMLFRAGRFDLLTIKSPEIKKTSVKNCIKSGEEFEGATLESTQSLIIK